MFALRITAKATTSTYVRRIKERQVAYSALFEFWSGDMLVLFAPSPSHICPARPRFFDLELASLLP